MRSARPLYEMLSSKPPFYNGDVASQVREVIAPPINQRRVTLGIAGDPIPKHWEETIAACLAKHPEQRPRSAAEVASRLRLGGTVRLTVAREIPRPVFERYVKARRARRRRRCVGRRRLFLIAPTCPRPATNAGPPFKPATPDGLRARVDRQTCSGGKNCRAATETRTDGRDTERHAAIGHDARRRELRDLSRTGRKQDSARLGAAAQLAPHPNQSRTSRRADTRSSFITRAGPTFARKSRCSRGKLSRSNTPSLMAARRSPASPDGAEIFAGEISLGLTPLTVDLPLGNRSWSPVTLIFRKRPRRLRSKARRRRRSRFNFARAAARRENQSANPPGKN